MSQVKHIKIYADASKGCIFFEGTTVEPKFLGIINCTIHPNGTRLVITRNDRLRADGVTPRTIFRRLNPSRVQNEQGVNLMDDLGYTIQQVADYINEQGSLTGTTTQVVNTSISALDFVRDETNTTIMLSNGEEFGINAVKAVEVNGDVHIFAMLGGDAKFTVPFDGVTIAGASAGNTVETVVNNLNAYFTMSALGGGVNPAPVFNLDGGTEVDFRYAGTVIDPVGDSQFGSSSSGTDNARFWSLETIDEMGEYFTVKVTGMGRFGVGLYDASTDALLDFETDDNTDHSGLMWSQWFYDYGSYVGPWTWYGSNTATSSAREGWSGATDRRFATSPIQTRLANLEPVLLKVGITDQGKVACWYYDEGRSNEWIMVSRTGYTLPEGQYGLAVKLYDTDAQIVDTPLRYATDPTAPTLYYRYIESPDGSFHYPLFASEAEANWYDSQNGGTGTGSSHSHVYVDDPSGTSWYMPDNGSVMGGLLAPLSTADVVYTEIPTSSDDLYQPSAFSGTPVTVDENTLVNYQTQPADTYYTTTVSGLPAGMILRSDGMITGNAPEVSGDTSSNPSDTYTITVYRTNDYGTSTGTLELIVNNTTAPAAPPAGFNLVSGGVNQDGSLQPDSVVSIDGGLEAGKRYVVPQSWVNLNVLPFLDGSLDKAYFGVPATDAIWNSVNLHEDFDAVMRWEWTGNYQHKSSVTTANSADANHVSINSSTDSYYAYALEWDGTDLSVLRSASLSDLETKHISELASSVVYTESGYTNQSGTLPLVFATKTGGSMLISVDGMNVIDIPDAPTSILTPWTKALDFSGSSERAAQVSTSSMVNPLMMNGLGVTTSVAQSGMTSDDFYARPWACACVFKYDHNNSNQHIWNQGEGVGGDNIYLRMSSGGYLYFGWGRDGQGVNECNLGGTLVSDQWWGVFVAHNGTRLSGSNATAANLAECFDIYLMRVPDGGTDWEIRTHATKTDAEGNRSIASNWTQTGYRMDRSNVGGMTLGGRGANRSFHGKIASMVVTTLRRFDTMPTKAEAELMVTDPKQWELDYRVGQTVRAGNSSGNVGYSPANIVSGYGMTQMWLMGDGAIDSYSNMIRNEIWNADQNHTKLNLISMVANDIQTVTIPGLS